MEQYYLSFFQYIEQYILLTAADKALIKQTFVPHFAKKDSIIEPCGRVPLYHNFIISGHLRSFQTDDQGNEITTDLNEGPRFFTSYFHFINQTVSPDTLYCLTDCELLRISYADAQLTAKLSQTQREFTVKLFEQLLAEAQQKNWEMANLSAEKRYENFVAKHPNLSKNVALSYIASFLGITLRHLSRIRKKDR